jgi:hypothetical protein
MLRDKGGMAAEKLPKGCRQLILAEVCPGRSRAAKGEEQIEGDHNNFVHGIFTVSIREPDKLL